MVKGILQLIGRRKIAEAESKISDISIAELQDSLYLLLNTRAGLFGIEQNNWEEFDKRVNKISDKQIKDFLYVMALYALDSQKQNKNLFADYLFQAGKNLEAVEDKTSKAQGLFALAALILSSDKVKGQLLFFDALRALKNAPDFRDATFEITVIVPGQTANFKEFLYKEGFEKSFMLLAKTDWLDAQVQTNQITSPGLKAIAQIAAAKAALQ